MQSSTIDTGPAYWVSVFLGLAIIVVLIVAAWKMFTKAGKPGWAALIPFYNTYVILKIVGRPGWWLVLYFIPLVNIVISIIVMFDLAKSFGKGKAFGFFALFLFSFIGFCILGYGSARYVGPAAAQQDPHVGQVEEPPYPTV